METQQQQQTVKDEANQPLIGMIRQFDDENQSCFSALRRSFQHCVPQF